jgi:hypothetical protein
MLPPSGFARIKEFQREISSEVAKRTDIISIVAYLQLRAKHKDLVEN